MSDARRWLAASLGLGVVLGMGEACILPDPDHCAHGGDPCAEGLVCDACSPSTVTSNGCVSAEEMLDTLPDADGCQAASSTATTEDPTVGEESTTVTTTEPPETTTIDLDTTATEVTTNETTTTGPMVDCMEADGELGSDCPDIVPFCVGGMCVGCTNPLADCAAVDAPGGDVCDASGACVLCNEEDATACSGDAPVCDPEANVCVPCSAHEQCAPSACNLFDGTCVGGMVVNAGSMQQYTTLNAAVTALGGEGTIIVHPGTYNETVTVIGSDVVVAFLAAPGAPPEWQRTSGGGAPQLRANTNATVLVDGIEFRANTSASEPALRADEGARLWVDRSTIAQNSGVAVRAEVNSEAVLRNCFVAGATNLAVLNVAMSSSATVRHSTLLGNFGMSRALSCDAGSSAAVFDSILLTLGSLDEVACDGITVETTAATMMLPGGTMVPAADEAWFANPATGDLHLTKTGQQTFMGIAEWNDGDPLVDIDGDARSGVEGTPEHAGADFIP